MAKKFETLRAQMSLEASARSDARTKSVLDALARDIDGRAEVLRPINTEFVDRIRLLVVGVEVDLDQPLPPEVDTAAVL